MKKQLSILGSTGSIGRQALDILPHTDYEVLALTGNKNVSLLECQARQHRPKLVAMADEAAAKALALALADTSVRVAGGANALVEAASMDEADLVLSAIVGMAGLFPTLAAIDAGKPLALANKEALVCAGHLVMKRAQEKGILVIPVDSEHSAIFQCLNGYNTKDVKRIILTASGGPFFGQSREALRSATKRQALRHPNWSMGEKITIDSATMMNKGLELIEAMWLYNLSEESIDIVIHPQSIVHSMVEFVDHSVLAQLAVSDMRMPIQYALNYPVRRGTPVPSLNLVEAGALTFFPPDEEAFPALRLARGAAVEKGNRGAVMSGANEAAVDLFLSERISFLAIAEVVEDALARLPFGEGESLEELLEADVEARKVVYETVK